MHRRGAGVGWVQYGGSHTYTHTRALSMLACARGRWVGGRREVGRAREGNEGGGRWEGGEAGGHHCRHSSPTSVRARERARKREVTSLSRAARAVWVSATRGGTHVRNTSVHASCVYVQCTYTRAELSWREALFPPPPASPPSCLSRFLCPSCAIYNAYRRRRERERDRQQPISSEKLRGSPNTPVLSLCSCAPHDDDDGGSGGTPTTTYTRRGVSTSSSSAVATALRLGTSIRRWRLSVVFSVVRSDRKRQRARERGRERRETGDRAIWQQWLQAITDIVAVDWMEGNWLRSNFSPPPTCACCWIRRDPSIRDGSHSALSLSLALAARALAVLCLLVLSTHSLTHSLSFAHTHRHTFLDESPSLPLFLWLLQARGRRSARCKRENKREGRQVTRGDSKRANERKRAPAR